MLRVESISKRFRAAGGEVRALDAVSLELPAGRFIAVRGPSGCGKSTLLLAAGGLLAPDGGRVMIEGTDVYAMSAEARSRMRAAAIGFVFQRFHLVPYLTVLENVLAPSIASGGNDAKTHGMELIERFGLSHRARHYPAQLSTGERQRVALARAMLNRPKVLLADEPTGNLDPENAQTVLSALRDFAGGGGAVLLVTHDPNAAALADQVVRMDGGRLAEKGT